MKKKIKIILSIVFILWFSILMVANKKEDDIRSTSQTSIEEQLESKSEMDIKFRVSNVRNDVTGNWRIAKISERIAIEDYVIDYYKEYFKSDDEIHAIVNFTYNTTAKISVIGNLLDVTVHEYVEKEEHDAKLLFSGMVLKQYHIDMETGEIEEIK